MNKQKILPSPAGLNHSVRQVISMPSSSSSTAVSTSFYSSTVPKAPAGSTSPASARATARCSDQMSRHKNHKRQVEKFYLALAIYKR